MRTAHAAPVRPALSKDHLGPTLPRTILRRRPKAKGLERIASGSFPKPDVDRESVANDALVSPSIAHDVDDDPRVWIDKNDLIVLRHEQAITFDHRNLSDHRAGRRRQLDVPRRRLSAANIGPKPDGLTLMSFSSSAKKFLNVAQRRQAPHLHNHGRTDRFWRAIEISERVA